MLTNEAIEVHLSYLRPAVDDVKNELPKLRQEIKALDEKLSTKLNALDERLSTKLNALDERLSTNLNVLDERLSTKIDKLTERVLEMQGNQKGLILFLTIAGLLVSGVSVARTLNWI